LRFTTCLDSLDNFQAVHSENLLAILMPRLIGVVKFAIVIFTTWAIINENNKN